ncbi:lipid-A-disaccharide synthase [Segatella copri]|jgi:lipid-A-disaccharide synthase|uniref:Lipid-A-disaccharide synthase n=1 Tax=Segatella copri TaxID=165179 RepID=A0A6G1U3A2_9BACT|nr:lipid-A-disaccharide synthase [Segatella copri]MBV3402509.1 lipid-A-disaccharide synthase [Segatella copri]MBW0048367.1 lipid-A-disaccharide synthase [Segatella copri]MQN81897.1 lipid-A-disaccharide synthase [Segatella copri]
MKYYLIVGEASGDLHASRLMRSLKKVDEFAEFRFFGGDLMAAEGGTRVKHYKELAYMGFVPVLLHLGTIFSNMKMCKDDIVKWKPDVVILVDYPGFNLNIAKFLKKKTNIPAYYYISPKIWAWKEWRIRSIRRDIAEMFSILPFEVPFYEKKHHYPIHYVGNPTAQEVNEFRAGYQQPFEEFCTENQLDIHRPILALLAGSRLQEIKDNLPAMIEVAERFEDFQMVLAGAPSIEDKYYEQFVKGTPVKMVRNKTYQLLSHSTAALVTSGTATLETALFNVPQVVCYETPLPRLVRFAFDHIMSCKYISLVNLIADKEVVQEMFADRFKVDAIADQLYQLLPGKEGRERMLAEYQVVRERLGNQMAPDEAATIMHGLLVKRRERLLRLAKERAEAEAAAEAARKKAEEAKRLAEEEAKRAKQAAEQLSQTQKEEME